MQYSTTAATYDSGKMCPKDHTTLRLVSNRRCPQCHRESVAKWDKENLERRRVINRRYNATDKGKARIAKYNGSAKGRIAVAKYRANDRERNQSISNVIRRGYAHAIDPTANRQDLALFYELARRLTRLTGISHEVDHLRSLKNGGMHTVDNLCVLTKSQNRRKGDRSLEDCKRLGIEITPIFPRQFRKPRKRAA